MKTLEDGRKWFAVVNPECVCVYMFFNNKKIFLVLQRYALHKLSGSISFHLREQQLLQQRWRNVVTK